MDKDQYIDAAFKMIELDGELEKINVPAIPLPGESEEDAIMRYFFELGILFEDKNGIMYADIDKAYRFNPTLARYLEILFRAEQQSTLDELEAKGLVYSSVDDSGSLVYGITEEGRRKIEYENQ